MSFLGDFFFAVEVSKVAVSVDFASCSYLPINQMQISSFFVSHLQM